MKKYNTKKKSATAHISYIIIHWTTQTYLICTHTEKHIIHRYMYLQWQRWRCQSSIAYKLTEMKCVYSLGCAHFTLDANLPATIIHFHFDRIRVSSSFASSHSRLEKCQVVERSWPESRIASSEHESIWIAIRSWINKTAKWLTVLSLFISVYVAAAKQMQCQQSWKWNFCMKKLYLPYRCANALYLMCAHSHIQVVIRAANPNPSNRPS